MLSHWLNWGSTQVPNIEPQKKREKKLIWFSHLQYIRSTYCNAKSAFSRVAPNFISLENEALRKNIITSIFCTQRKYLEFPVRKYSIYQLEDTAENGGCCRFCYHTHFMMKILFNSQKMVLNKKWSISIVLYNSFKQKTLIGKIVAFHPNNKTIQQISFKHSVVRIWICSDKRL